ncbi:LysR family transcriptional regulator [Aestuariirhabdus litorea]|uniref:LysR family transcriptional regulator n=1 Tax=Aestuariirhabdus litorea TaxID=2528527 RepID=A0A3P3VMX8_9GAMM|nr:LysR family transcriptional regulator [Aestuariirhabdus litorea]RRJ83059.1 LysR family transcriptional regulator [Aestuariirhabdus litorea]RWW93217.1 LysR family transcriptional regulator [Endozoicomonadaceae bacterium GTF-13]
MRIRNLNSFIKVASLGSFHAAAQQLHASQPAISARIASLEEELGVQLFQRDKSGTRLTARGMQLLPFARKLVAVHEEMKAQLRDSAPQRGVVRVGVADTLAQLWMAPLLKRWQRQFPLLQFEFSVDLSHELWRALHEHELDLALMVSEQASGELVVEPLSACQQCWVASPALGLKGEAALETLLRHPILSFPRNTRPWRYLQGLLAPLAEQTEAAEPILYTCSSVANLMTLAEQGCGVALLPEPLVRAALERGVLQRIGLDPEPPLLEFCCAWRLDDERLLPRLLAEEGRRLMEGAADG